MEFVEFLESKETSSVVVFALIDIADAAWKATTIFVKKKKQNNTLVLTKEAGEFLFLCGYRTECSEIFRC